MLALQPTAKWSSPTQLNFGLRGSKATDLEAALWAMLVYKLQSPWVTRCHFNLVTHWTSIF
jgi:hypothetical protein